MRKRVSVLLVFVIMLSLIITPVYAQEQDLVKVTVDGILIEFDVPPTIVSGRTLVPLRAIFEALGVEPIWNGETRTVTANKGDTTVILPIGSKHATVRGNQIELDVPATIINGRTLVPARFIAESLGATVGWDGETRTVIINSTVTNTVEIKVHFIDVGQADSIFIDAGDYDILIDAGNNDDGDLVVNYLKTLGTDDIEIMVATHPHEDHIGGLDNVLANFDVETIIDSGMAYSSGTYQSYYSYAQNEGANFTYDSDMSFDLGNGAIFKVIETGDGYEGANDNSVVTLLDYNDIEFLFTGDMESKVELLNISKFSDVDVLKVGHHGSNSSTCQSFLNKVDPEYAVISTGKGNKYGHPSVTTLDRLQNAKLLALT